MRCNGCSLELGGRDLFCPSCGREVIHFTISPGRVRFYVENERPAPVVGSVSLVNGGDSSFEVSARRLPPWLSVQEAGPLSVEPQSERRIALRVDPAELGDQSYCEGAPVVFQIPSSNVERQVLVE